MEIVLITMAIAAAVTDLRARRIPNWIPVSGATLGFVLHIWNGGFHGALSSLAGAALGLGIFITLYIAGGMGAGDVKLFSAVGAIVGPHALIYVFISTGLLGGIAALALAIARGRLRETLQKTQALALGIRTAAMPDSLRLPYGAVIAAGALVSLVFFRI